MRRRCGIKNFFYPILAASVFVTVFSCIFLPVMAAGPQPLTDLLLEDLSFQNINKSGELTLLYVLLFLSVLGIGLWHYRFSRLDPRRGDAPSAAEKIGWLCFLPIICSYILFGRPRPELACLFIAVFFLYIYDKKQIYIHLALLVNAYVATLAFFAICCTVLPDISISSTLLALASGFVFCIVLALKVRVPGIRAKYIITAGLQIPAPLSLLVFLIDRYRVENSTVTLPYDPAYVYFMYGLMSLLVLHSAFFFYKYVIKEKAPLARRLIFPATIATFMVLSCSEVPRLFIVDDWHHQAESYVPFEQVYYYGKTLYKDFLNSAGCYPIVFGFISNIFLDGSTVSFVQAQALASLLALTVSAYLLYRAFGPEVALLCALPLWGFATGYNRVIPLLPFLLLLFQPAIVRRRNLWLQAYVLCSLFMALYYPLYGGAYCLGGLPFALVQLYGIVKNKEFGGKCFSISWLLCLAVVAYFLPLTIRVAQYTLMMSSQSIMADGIAIADHLPGGGFMPYLSGLKIRTVLYHSTYYLWHTLPILFFVSSLFIYIFQGKSSGMSSRPSTVLALTLPPVMLLVLYQYSTLRIAFEQMLMGTTAPVLPLVNMVATAALWAQARPLFQARTLVLIVVSVMVLGYAFGAQRTIDYSPYLRSFHSVPKGHSVISDELLAKAPKFGRGIIGPAAIEQFKSLESRMNSIEGTDIPLGQIVNGAMVFKVFERAASATIRHLVINSTVGQNRLIEMYEKDRPIIFGVNSVEHYWIYRYLAANYAMINGMFVPPERIPFIKDPRETPWASVSGYKWLHNRASFLGRGFESLRHKFDVADISHEVKPHDTGKGRTFAISSPRKFRGEEADFIYVKFSARPPKKIRQYPVLGAYFNERQEVSVNWENMAAPAKPHSMLMTYETGELLIPLGANPYWLTEEHLGFSITVTNPEAVALDCSVEELVFLKLVR